MEMSRAWSCGKSCSPSLHSELHSDVGFVSFFACAPDLTSLPYLLAPDQHRGWKRGLLAVLEVKFHYGNEPKWSPDGVGFNRRMSDEHKLSFM